MGTRTAHRAAAGLPAARRPSRLYHPTAAAEALPRRPMAPPGPGLL